MKKSSFCLISSLAFLVMSCSQDDQLQVVENSDDFKLEQPKVVLVENGSVVPVTRSVNDSSKLALSFSNEQSFLNFKKSLENVSDYEKQEIVSRLGFRSLHDLADKADDELECLGKNATSETVFRDLYAKYVKKYNGLLIRNDVDTTDLTLYVPDGDNLNSYMVNESSQIVIGGKVISINLQNKLPETVVDASKAIMSYDNGVSTFASTDDVNHFVYSPKKHKRVYFNAYMRGVYMWVQMYAKKKMWYGWKNDPNREYFFDSFLSSTFEYQYQQPNGAVISMRLPRYIFNNNVKNGFNIVLGKTNASVITGEIRTWTDMTSEHDSDGKQLSETVEGHLVPKCLLSKAKICKINLKMQ